MEMTLQELFDAYEFEDIEDRLGELYPKNFKRNVVGYEEAFERIKEIQDEVCSSYVLNIVHVEDEVPYEHVTCELNGETYSLSMTPWKEWLGMTFQDYLFDIYEALDILCHCLWEMTFLGYNEKDIERFVKETESAILELKAEDEFDDIDEEAEGIEILEKMYKHEISSSSSDD